MTIKDVKVLKHKWGEYKVKSDKEYMELALELALKGWGKTNPNPLVGALIVNNGEVVGRGYHEQFGGPHGEVIAIEDAGELCRGGTMYVTLEPCSHHGKTPPCVEKIIEAGLKKVVLPWLDPNEKVSGRGVKRLREAGIEVEVGPGREQAMRQNEIFAKYITRSLPFVISKWAMSMDGKIATHTGDSKWITSEEARLDVHLWRARSACIMVGINTVIKDDPLLNCRHPHYTSHHPVRVILDTNLRIPLDSKLVKSAKDFPTVIACGKNVPQDKTKALKQKKVGIKACSGSRSSISNSSLKSDTDKDEVDIKELFFQLGNEGYDSILVEGGRGVHGKLLEFSLMDKVMCYMGNKIIGGVEALSPVGGEGMATVEKSLNITNINVQLMGENIKVTGYPSL